MDFHGGAPEYENILQSYMLQCESLHPRLKMTSKYLTKYSLKNLKIKSSTPCYMNLSCWEEVSE